MGKIVDIDQIEADQVDSLSEHYNEESGQYEVPDDHPLAQFGKDPEEPNPEENKDPDPEGKDLQEPVTLEPKNPEDQRTPEQIENDRLRQELRDTKGKLTSVEEKQAQADRDKILNEFKPLSEDEEKQMKDVDPDKFIKYQEDKFNYQQTKATQEQQEEMEHHQSQNGEIMKFLADVGKTNLTEDQKAIFLHRLQNEESEEYKLVAKVAAHLESEYRPDEKGLYSVDKFQKAYNDLNLPDVLEDSRRSGREEAVNAINNANNNPSQSALANHQSNVDEHGNKSLEDLSQAEINKMSEEDIDKYLQKEGASIYES